MPLAREALTADDWADIDKAFLDNDDPLFGSKARAEFRELFHRIVNLAPESIGLGGHSGGEGFAFGLQRVRRFHQQRTSLARNHGGPGRKGFGGGIYRSPGIFCRGGGGARGDALVKRVAALEGGTIGGGTRSAANQHLNIAHGGISQKRVVGSASPTVRQNGPLMPKKAINGPTHGRH